MNNIQQSAFLVCLLYHGKRFSTSCLWLGVCWIIRINTVWFFLVLGTHWTQQRQKMQTLSISSNLLVQIRQ